MNSPQWPICALCLEPSWFPCQWKELHNHAEDTSSSGCEKWVMNCQQSTMCCCQCLQKHLQFLYKNPKQPQLLRCLLCPQSMSLPALKKDQLIPYSTFIQPNWILMKLDPVVYSCRKGYPKKDEYDDDNHNTNKKIHECAFQGTQVELFQHHTECMDRQIQCLFCHEFVMKKEIDTKTHYRTCSQCKQCPECTEFIPKKEVSFHMKNTHGRSHCVWCKSYVLTDTFEVHRQTRCPKRHELVHCPFTMTCQFGKVRLCDLGHHYEHDHLNPLKEMEIMYRNMMDTLKTTTLPLVPSFLKRQKRWISKTIEDYEFEQHLVSELLHEWKGDNL